MKQPTYTYTVIRAFILGVREGWHYSQVGVTWGDSRDNAYDHGVNLSQRIRHGKVIE